jgi:hypothetical protein
LLVKFKDKNSVVILITINSLKTKMSLKIIRYTIAAVFLIFFSSINAQDDYRSEIGVLGGNSFYLGDANNKFFANSQLGYGIIYRHKIDTRLAWSASWNKTKVVGSTFSNPINAFDICGEFNFFDYENKIYRPNSKKQSLYLFGGLGFMTSSSGTPAFAMSLPVGLGYKIMLGKRFNLNFIWSNRLMLTDNMEGVAALNDPDGLNGSNIFNNDVLTTFSVGLTYNIWKKDCNCMKLKY